MATFDLDEDLVREFVGTLHESEDELPSGQIGRALKAQLPLPVPTKIGAVVRTRGAPSEYRTWVLGRLPGIWFTPEDEAGAAAYFTREIGRIVEVLAPGVDIP